MRDRGPALTRDNVREEARDILSALDATRSDSDAFENNWRKLWQLVREAKAAFLPTRDPNHGPWHLNNDLDQRPHGESSKLTAGTFVVSIWPRDQAGLGADLPGLLNWAGVPTPLAR